MGDDKNCNENISKDEQILFNIKEVSKMIGVVPATIRNWEREGIFTSKRKDNNYRVFNFEDIEFLAKIKEYSKEKNMSISMIKQLILKDDTPYQGNDKKYFKDIYHTKLKNYREKGGYTLEEVSSAVGISTSYLSKIEQENVNVSFDILDRLAKFYGESTILFFDIKSDADNEVVRKGEGKTLQSVLNGVKMESLIDTSESAFEVVRFTVNPNSGDFISHSHCSGGEFIYLLKGQLQVTLDDAKEFVLNAGDSIHFKSNRAHKWHNPEKQVCELIWVHTYL